MTCDVVMVVRWLAGWLAFRHVSIACPSLSAAPHNISTHSLRSCTSHPRPPRACVFRHFCRTHEADGRIFLPPPVLMDILMICKTQIYANPRTCSVCVCLCVFCEWVCLQHSILNIMRVRHTREHILKCDAMRCACVLAQPHKPTHTHTEAALIGRVCSCVCVWKTI